MTGNRKRNTGGLQTEKQIPKVSQSRLAKNKIFVLRLLAKSILKEIYVATYPSRFIGTAVEKLRRLNQN